eukprot:SAG11_NODE_4528_length_1863_cov_4.993764_3_plen_108_part_00
MRTPGWTVTVCPGFKLDMDVEVGLTGDFETVEWHSSISCVYPRPNPAEHYAGRDGIGAAPTVAGGTAVYPDCPGDLIGAQVLPRGFPPLVGAQSHMMWWRFGLVLMC